ncbi:MAG: orotate phosphoribosyltransferase [Pseudomonadota bacterium]
MTQENPRDRLRDIIREKSFKYGDFTLASGKKSDVFFNMKLTMLDPEGSQLLADAILEIMTRDQIRVVGGIAVGGVPLVAAVCVKSYPTYPVKAFYVRDKVKDHGIMEQVDGFLDDGDEVILLDDVITTGGSVMKAVKAARGRNCRIRKIVTVVDRCEGGRENLAAEGLDLEALYDRSDFVPAAAK